MSISCTCSGCGRAFRVGEEMAGRKARCKCGGVTVIPAPAPAPDPGFDPFGLGDSGEEDSPPEEVSPIAPTRGRGSRAEGPGTRRKKPRGATVEVAALLGLLGLAALAALVAMSSASLKVPALGVVVLAGLALGGYGAFSYFRVVGMPGPLTIVLLCFLPVVGLIAWTGRWSEAPRAALMMWLGMVLGAFGFLEIVFDHRPGLRPDLAPPPTARGTLAPAPDPSRFDPSLAPPRTVAARSAVEYRSRAPKDDPTARLLYNIESPDPSDRTVAWMQLGTAPVAEAHRAAVVALARKNLRNPDAMTRAFAVEALARWSPPDDDLGPTLIDLVGDVASVSSVAMRELAARKDARALDAIAARMAYDDRVVSAADALGRYGPEAEDTLLAVLGGKPALGRFWACVELGEGKAGTDRSLAALEAAAGDGDPRVAGAARAAIEAIRARSKPKGTAP